MRLMWPGFGRRREVDTGADLYAKSPLIDRTSKSHGGTTGRHRRCTRPAHPIRRSARVDGTCRRPVLPLLGTRPPSLSLYPLHTHLCCATLAQVVPDVSPGFNVPQFYAQFVEQRKAEVGERVALVQSARGKSPKTALPR